jgi:hypothetical protein
MDTVTAIVLPKEPRINIKNMTPAGGRFDVELENRLLGAWLICFFLVCHMCLMGIGHTRSFAYACFSGTGFARFQVAHLVGLFSGVGREFLMGVLRGNHLCWDL